LADRPSTADTNSSKDRDTRHAEALARFKLASDAEAPQRQRELEDLRFCDFDEQWPDDVKKARDGYAPGGGLPSVPARPCLTINKLRQPVIQTSNEARQAKLSLQFAPKGDGATREIAEVFEDISRAIQADSRAHLARQWAYDRAIKSGRGYYRILTDYANDGDFDQDIIYKRILNQSSVYVDPSATEPDWSDGMWAFIVEDVPFDRYKRQFPRSKLAKDATDDPGVLDGIGDEQPEWVKNTETGGQVVRIAEYFYVEYARHTIGLYAFPDGSERTVRTDDPSVAGLEPQQTREIETRSVKWCKLNGVEILEDGDWPGRYIPIVPVIADEANVNGERRWTGLVRPAMDAQRSYNVMRSAQVEGVGLAPRAPWVGYAETFEGYEGWWAQANTRNFAYLPIKMARDGTGAALPPPQRNVVEPAIQAITLAAHEADSDIKATTGRFDASLGNLSANERSGKAIQALQKQGEQGSVGYLDNLATMSIVLEGKILLDLIPAIYSRPGRILAAVGADDQRRSIMVGQPFVKGKDGLPQGVPPGQPPPPEAKHFDLSQGKYSVAVTVGKSYTTRREESVSMMGQLAEAAPQMVPLFADLWVGNMDFPGAKQIQDRLKKQLPPELQDQGDDQPEIPPQVRQQMQQAQQMIDMLQQELDAKNEIIERELTKEQAETERQLAKLQADIDTAKMDNESKEKIAAMQIERDLLLAQLQQQTAQLQAQQTAAVEGQKMQHAASMQGQKLEAGHLQAVTTQAMSQGHEADMAAQTHQQQRELQAQQAADQRALQAQGAEEQAGLQEQAAELAPEPQGAAQ
jgi:hypothetical protein